jgi:CDP-diacylglycerol--glycerol-3-phosphate 3-phosphatidyltransferase
VAKRPLITANHVTVARLLLIPLPAYLLYTNLTGQWIAVILGTLLGITDIVDGYLARRDGPTVLGALLDPIADKVFLAATYVPLADLGLVPYWVVALVFVREFLITSLRSIYERRHLRMETSYVAKVKTWIQMIGLALFVFVGSIRVALSPVLIMAVLAAVGLASTVVLLARRSRHTWVAATLTGWAVTVGVAERLWGRPGATLAVAILVLLATWWSGLEYLVGGMRRLRGHRPLDAGDVVRFASALLPVLVIAVLGRTHQVCLLALLFAVELAHGGLDNLLSHHRADMPAATWAARVVAIGTALAIGLVRPRWALVSIGAALAMSILGASLAFWLRRAIYLADAAIDEPER